MQLLIQRGQRASRLEPLGRPVFKLWAKFELEKEEDALIQKYKVRQAVLTEGDMRLELLRAGRYSLLVRRELRIAGMYGLVAGMAAGVFFFPDDFMPGVGLGFLIFIVSTYLIYQNIREQVRVSDILDGRFFTCRSVVTLMAKEQEIAEMAHAFRHLLEAMKNWGGKELIELKPYQAPAMRVIEPPQAAAAISGRAGLSPRASVWLSVFGVITAVMVGGYLYLARPVGETSK